MSFFIFKQKTAYEMRISDWSSDVCSSYLHPFRILELHVGVELVGLQQPVVAVELAEEPGGRGRLQQVGAEVEVRQVAFGQQADHRADRRRGLRVRDRRPGVAERIPAPDPEAVQDRKSTSPNSRH